MKSTLGEFWNKNVTSLWISGHAIAGGETYTQNLEDEGEDYCDLHELIDNGLSFFDSVWDLSGEVAEDGSCWSWDGKADFRDTQGNSYYRMQVFVSGQDKDLPEQTRDEIVAAVEAADVCCPEQVCDTVLSVAQSGGDWKAELAKAKANDADERKALGVGE